MSLFYKNEIRKKEIVQTYVKGVPTTSETPITTFQGNIQPYKGKSAMDQVEGIQSSGMMLCFSEEKLNIASAEASRKGTYVLYHDNWYECIQELDWGAQEGPFADLSYYRYAIAWREVNA